MKQICLQVNIRVASQDITCFLWNLKVHFHVQESTTCPISEPHESVAHFATLLHFILNISSGL